MVVAILKMQKKNAKAENKCKSNNEICGNYYISSISKTNNYKIAPL